ncbi:Lecithin-cholesterol acyltransferase-like 4 [Heracleum sosnowskyi]|uniref:Lecithin-cholesterol acyltransferase-like 4 n=1 Tax=Heracleum sosnowskyi TaxID=360622 RepID=A0AAD8HF36_9APIA|nr:Lecithin-cholesterol acyltransferase-like 4 [Heracleum sosnowskyi]
MKRAVEDSSGLKINCLRPAIGKEERVWVRIFGSDCDFCTKLWSRFDPKSGKTVLLDQKTNIVVPHDRDGLYAIDVLDPDMVKQDKVYDYMKESNKSSNGKKHERRSLVQMKNWKE